MKVDFISSVVKLADCPDPEIPEYALIGRSNVGKSSLLNALAGQKKLAKVSGSPGKTQTINHFLVDQNWYLVDLPGYGFAKVSKSLREKWQKMISAYFKNRPNLVMAFLLIDSRLPMQASDKEMFLFFGENQIPFSILFTKCDKLSKTKLDKAITSYKKELENYFEPLPNYILTSASSGQGKEDILQMIELLNPQFSTGKE
jgi:GTP-binding protein